MESIGITFEYNANQLHLIITQPFDAVITTYANNGTTVLNTSSLGSPSVFRIPITSLTTLEGMKVTHLKTGVLTTCFLHLYDDTVFDYTQTVGVSITTNTSSSYLVQQSGTTLQTGYTIINFLLPGYGFLYYTLSEDISVPLNTYKQTFSKLLGFEKTPVTLTPQTMIDLKTIRVTNNTVLIPAPNNLDVFCYDSISYPGYPAGYGSKNDSWFIAPNTTYPYEDILFERNTSKIKVGLSYNNIPLILKASNLTEFTSLGLDVVSNENEVIKEIIEGQEKTPNYLIGNTVQFKAYALSSKAKINTKNIEGIETPYTQGDLLYLTMNPQVEPTGKQINFLLKSVGRDGTIQPDYITFIDSAINYIYTYPKLNYKIRVLNNAIVIYFYNLAFYQWDISLNINDNDIELTYNPETTAPYITLYDSTVTIPEAQPWSFGIDFTTIKTLKLSINTKVGQIENAMPAYDVNLLEELISCDMNIATPNYVISEAYETDPIDYTFTNSLSHHYDFYGKDKKLNKANLMDYCKLDNVKYSITNYPYIMKNKLDLESKITITTKTGLSNAQSTVLNRGISIWVNYNPATPNDDILFEWDANQPTYNLEGELENVSVPIMKLVKIADGLSLVMTNNTFSYTSFMQIDSWVKIVFYNNIIGQTSSGGVTISQLSPAGSVVGILATGGGVIFNNPYVVLTAIDFTEQIYLKSAYSKIAGIRIYDQCETNMLYSFDTNNSIGAYGILSGIPKNLDTHLYQKSIKIPLIDDANTYNGTNTNNIDRYLLVNNDELDKGDVGYSDPYPTQQQFFPQYYYGKFQRRQFMHVYRKYLPMYNKTITSTTDDGYIDNGIYYNTLMSPLKTSIMNTYKDLKNNDFSIYIQDSIIDNKAYILTKSGTNQSFGVNDTFSIAIDIQSELDKAYIYLGLKILNDNELINPVTQLEKKTLYNKLLRTTDIAGLSLTQKLIWGDDISDLANLNTKQIEIGSDSYIVIVINGSNRNGGTNGIPNIRNHGDIIRTVKEISYLVSGYDFYDQVVSVESHLFNPGATNGFVEIQDDINNWSRYNSNRQYRVEKNDALYLFEGTKYDMYLQDVMFIENSNVDYKTKKVTINLVNKINMIQSKSIEFYNTTQSTSIKEVLIAIFKDSLAMTTDDVMFSVICRNFLLNLPYKIPEFARFNTNEFKTYGEALSSITQLGFRIWFNELEKLIIDTDVLERSYDNDLANPNTLQLNSTDDFIENFNMTIKDNHLVNKVTIDYFNRTPMYEPSEHYDSNGNISAVNNINQTTPISKSAQILMDNKLDFQLHSDVVTADELDALRINMENLAIMRVGTTPAIDLYSKIIDIRKV